MARVGVAKTSGGFYIDGLTEARKSLALLPEAFKQQARDAIDIGSAITLTEAARRVPVRYGNLKRSLGRNVRDDGLQAVVGSSDWKAIFQEFGTSDTPRQSFLWPAYRQGARFIRQSMKNWAESAVGQATGGKVTVRGKINSTAKARDRAARLRAKK